MAQFEIQMNEADEEDVQDENKEEKKDEQKEDKREARQMNLSWLLTGSDREFVYDIEPEIVGFVYDIEPEIVGFLRLNRIDSLQSCFEEHDITIDDLNMWTEKDAQYGCILLIFFDIKT